MHVQKNKKRNQGNCYEKHDKIKKVVSTSVKTGIHTEWKLGVFGS